MRLHVCLTGGSSLCVQPGGFSISASQVPYPCKASCSAQAKGVPAACSTSGSSPGTGRSRAVLSVQLIALVGAPIPSPEHDCGFHQPVTPALPVQRTNSPYSLLLNRFLFHAVVRSSPNCLKPSTSTASSGKELQI